MDIKLFIKLLQSFEGYKYTDINFMINGEVVTYDSISIRTGAARAALVPTIEFKYNQENDAKRIN